MNFKAVLWICLWAAVCCCVGAQLEQPLETEAQPVELDSLAVQAAAADNASAEAGSVRKTRQFFGPPPPPPPFFGPPPPPFYYGGGGFGGGFSRTRVVTRTRYRGGGFGGFGGGFYG